MIVNVLAGGYVMLVLVLMLLTRKGQPRVRRPLPSEDESFMLLF